MYEGRGDTLWPAKILSDGFFWHQKSIFSLTKMSLKVPSHLGRGFPPSKSRGKKRTIAVRYSEKSQTEHCHFSFSNEKCVIFKYSIFLLKTSSSNPSSSKTSRLQSFKNFPVELRCVCCADSRQKFYFSFQLDLQKNWHPPLKCGVVLP